MLLTIRLASLAEGEDDDTLDQDFKSDIVDIDSGNNSEMIASPGMKILENSDINTDDGVDMGFYGWCI